MKYSSTVNFPRQASSIARGLVFEPQRLSRIGALERKNRMLSAACYFGLAPFLWFSGVIRQQNRLLNHHLQYSLAFSFTVLCAVIFDLVTDRLQYWLIVNVWSPTMAEFDRQAMFFSIFCLACVFGTVLIAVIWGLAWVSSVLGAFRGQSPYIPIVGWVASKFRVLRLAVYWTLLIEAGFLFLIGLGIHSAQLAKRMPDRADVYILYTQGGYIPAPGLYQSYTPPRWAVTMAFYPLVHAALDKFGEHGVTALPLSPETFDKAIHNGRFIFVASHGGASPGAFTISGAPYREFKPSDVDKTLVGDQLQYVYFAGCWTGDLESEWRRVLRLEDARMFGRISFVDEHMLWVWLKSAGVINGLE